MTGCAQASWAFGCLDAGEMENRCGFMLVLHIRTVVRATKNTKAFESSDSVERFSENSPEQKDETIQTSLRAFTQILSFPFLEGQGD